MKNEIKKLTNLVTKETEEGKIAERDVEIARRNTKVRRLWEVLEISRYKEVVAILPDTHVPNQDNKAFGLFLRCMQDLMPDRIIQLGDWFECAGISSFKVPYDMIELNKERDVSRRLISGVRSATSKSALEWKEGNHEARHRTKMMTHEFMPYASLPGMAFDVLSGLREDKVAYSLMDGKNLCFVGDNTDTKYRIVHGDEMEGVKRSPKATLSAHKTLYSRGGNGVMGHVHRIGPCTRREPRYGQYLETWIEAGCMCNRNPYYARNFDANWQLGFVILMVKTDGNVGYEVVTFENPGYVFRCGGREYSLENNGK